MDFLDIIITIAILGVGSLLTGSKKGKKAAQQQTAAPRPAAEPHPFQTIFESDEESSFEDVWDVEDSEEKFSEEPAGDTYFTYESPRANWTSEVHNEEAKPIQVQDDVAMRPRVMGEEFDLRKAFIYQTIMERVEC